MAPVQETSGIDFSSMQTGYLSFDASEGPVIRNPTPDFSSSYFNSSPYEEAHSSFWSNIGQSVTDTSDYIVGGLADIGGWWKGVKNSAEGGIDDVRTMAGIATSPDSLYSSYGSKVTGIIAEADGIPFEEAASRVPHGIRYQSGFSNAMGKIGSGVEALTGSLDVLEALHDEGGKAGSKTIKAVSKSVAQTSIGYLSGVGIGTIVAGAGIGFAGAPLLIGIAAGAGISWGVGKALDYLSGE